MTYFDTVINVKSLAALLAGSDPVVVDCRFYLDDEDGGRRAYEAGHVPTAQYAHLNEDLSDLTVSGGGRHPLPSEADMADLFGRLGISAGKQVVAYDDTNGVAAARLWWMLRYMGHEKTAVLDGGFPAWIAAGLPLDQGFGQKEAVQFTGRARSEMLVEMKDISAAKLLIDSRASERYRGELEPIDPIAGHIPGAINLFYQLNHDSDGRLLPPSNLRRRFEQLLNQVPAAETIFYCGSGVTACNNLLALAYSGLGEGRLYAGSWSQWCCDPKNPIVVSD